MSRTPLGIRLATLVSVLAAFSLALGCNEDPSGPGDDDPVYVVEVSGEEFRVRVSSPARVADFEARLSSGVEGVINGPLLPGDGGFNAPWSWHLDPDEVETADAAIEVCDGRPSMVEADLTYWLETLGRFCPWGARVTGRG